MHQEVFKTNLFMAVILPTIIFGLMILAFLGINSIDGSIPSWVLIFLIIPVVFAVSGQKTKLIVEDDILRYESGLFFNNHEEVSLHDVSQIVTRVIETWGTDSDGKTERSTKKITYVLDKSGKTFFTFSAGLVGKGNKQRFEETITAINPNIQIS